MTKTDVEKQCKKGRKLRLKMLNEGGRTVSVNVIGKEKKRKND